MSQDKPVQSNGIWDVSRKISVPSLVSDADATALIQALQGVAGVKTVVSETTQHCLVVRYDASVVDYLTLLQVLREIGHPPAYTWWARLKGNWYQFTDSNSRENANLPPPACCNKAPKKR